MSAAFLNRLLLVVTVLGIGGPTGVAPASERAQAEASAPGPQEEHDLLEIRSLLTAYDRLELAPIRPERLAKRLETSCWRERPRRAMGLLLNSSEKQDRGLGWRLANELFTLRSYSRAELHTLLPTDLKARFDQEPEPEVRADLIALLSHVDPPIYYELAASILDDGEQPETLRLRCTELLGQAPLEAQRERLWLLAVRDPILESACAFGFEQVAWSRPALDRMLSLLDSTTQAYVGASDVSTIVPLRVVVAENLRLSLLEPNRVHDELMARCPGEISLAEVQFAVAALMSARCLQPMSQAPQQRLANYLAKLPAARGYLLRHTATFFHDAEIKRWLIATIPELPVDDKMQACYWLSKCDDPAAWEALRSMTRDPHQGVRLAAFVLLAATDTTYHAEELREELLATAITHPAEFAMAFDEGLFEQTGRDGAKVYQVDQGILRLSLAGQSLDEAERWRAQTRSPELQDLCSGVIVDDWDVELAMGGPGCDHFDPPYDPAADVEEASESSGVPRTP